MVQSSDLEQLGDILSGVIEKLSRIDTGMQLLIEAFKPGPEHWRQIQEYPEFDWSAIGAEVMELDEWGATIVSWNGKVWKRRAPENEYGEAIWFSRCVGKENNKNIYATLIKFEEKEISTKVRALGSDVLQALKTHGVKPRSQRAKSDAATTKQPPPPPPPAPAAKMTEAAAAPQKAEPPATQKAGRSNGNGNSESKSNPLEGIPANLIKIAQAFLSMDAVFHDTDDKCYVVGVAPHIHTVRLNAQKQKVCDCEDFMTAAERETEKAICAHIVAVTLYYQEALKKQPQRAAK